MSIANPFAKLAFEFARNSSDDEYQEDIWFKSAAVSYFTLPLSLYTIGAILAWALPGYYTLWSVIVIFPLAFAEFVGQAWMKQRSPRPRSHINSTYTKMIVIPVVAMVAGIAYRLVTTDDVVMAGGVIVGVAVGAGFAAIVTPQILASVRKHDEQRLDAELDD